jgi:hypothetical protein
MNSSLMLRDSSSAAVEMCYRYAPAPWPPSVPALSALSDNALTRVPTVTVPPIPATPPVVAPPAAPSPVAFPLRWMLGHAAPPIQYRALCDVARLGPTVVEAAKRLPYAYEPALRLALSQHADGTWGGGMLALPNARSEYFEGIGTITAVRRLLEYGWDRESPPLMNARRILFRLLAEDDDPAYLYEFGGRGRLEPEIVHRGRAVLREAAAAALAQAGYEGDPRLRGAAKRITERIHEFLSSPLAEKPWVRVGNRHLLAPEAQPPSFHALQMLSYMPLFRSEHYMVLNELYHYLSQPLPRQEAVQLVGKEPVPQPQLVLGDMLPHRNALDADVPWGLSWLELMARLGFLSRNDGWSKLFDRMLDDRGADGIWHPHKGTVAPKSGNPLVWPQFPLESSGGDEQRWTDVTFRLGLIARLAGRPIELM